jgi:hypothetical protein
VLTNPLMLWLAWTIYERVTGQCIVVDGGQTIGMQLPAETVEAP